MNKCAKFHKDSPSDKKVKFNLARAIELSETAVFVYNFVLKPYASEQLRWHIWPTFLLNFLMKFSQKMPLYFFYIMVQKKSKMTKNSNQGGGPALSCVLLSVCTDCSKLFSGMVLMPLWTYMCVFLWRTQEEANVLSKEERINQFRWRWHSSQQLDVNEHPVVNDERAQWQLGRFRGEKECLNEGKTSKWW